MNRNSNAAGFVDHHDDIDGDDDDVVELVPCEDCGHLVPPANLEMHRLRGCPNRKQRPASGQRRRRRLHFNEDGSSRRGGNARCAAGDGASPSSTSRSSAGSGADAESDEQRQRSSSPPVDEEPPSFGEDALLGNGARDPPQNPGFVEPQSHWQQQTTAPYASRTAPRPVVQGRNVHRYDFSESPSHSAVAAPATSPPSSPWDRLASTISSAVCGASTAIEITDDVPPRGDVPRERGASRHRYPASRRNRPRPKSPPPSSQPQGEVIDILDSPPPAAAVAAARAPTRRDGSTVMDMSLVDSDGDDLPTNEDDGWACPRCTLQNPRSRTVCEACMYLLPRHRDGDARPPDGTRTDVLLPPGPPFVYGSAYGATVDDFLSARRGQSTPPHSSSSPVRSSSYVGPGAILGGVLGAASSYARGRPVARGALDGAMGGAMGGLAVDAVVQQQQLEQQRQARQQYLQQRQSEPDMAHLRRRRERRGLLQQPPGQLQPQLPRTRQYAGGDNDGTTRTFRMGNGTITVSTGRGSAMNPMMMDMLLQQSMMASMMRHGGLGGGQARWVVANGGTAEGGAGQGMNYEQLLHMFGDGTENLGAAEHQIEALPTSTVTSKDHNKGQCSICLQEFGVGDSFKTLPCLHCDFHTSCIDQWLKTNAVFPVCKHRLE